MYQDFLRRRTACKSNHWTINKTTTTVLSVSCVSPQEVPRCKVSWCSQPGNLDTTLHKISSLNLIHINNIHFLILFYIYYLCILFHCLKVSMVNVDWIDSTEEESNPINGLSDSPRTVHIHILYCKDISIIKLNLNLQTWPQEWKWHTCIVVGWVVDPYSYGMFNAVDSQQASHVLCTAASHIQGSKWGINDTLKMNLLLCWKVQWFAMWALITVILWCSLRKFV